MTETTIKNYQERAFRTMSKLGNNAIDGAHMAMGITTELEEMREGGKKNDVINVREEHGDCNWYIANECNIYGLSFERILTNASRYVAIPFKLHDLVDLHKKELAYGKKMDVEKLETQLTSLTRYLVEITQNFDFSYEDSLKINIDKLYQRYPGKFSAENALNRNLEKEGETLK